MTLDLKVIVTVGGVFGFIAFGGILVAIGVFSKEPEISKAGYLIITIGFIAIIGYFVSPFIKKKLK